MAYFMYCLKTCCSFDRGPIYSIIVIHFICSKSGQQQNWEQHLAAQCYWVFLPVHSTIHSQSEEADTAVLLHWFPECVARAIYFPPCVLVNTRQLHHKCWHPEGEVSFLCTACIDVSLRFWKNIQDVFVHVHHASLCRCNDHLAVLAALTRQHLQQRSSAMEIHWCWPPGNICLPWQNCWSSNQSFRNVPGLTFSPHSGSSVLPVKGLRKCIKKWRTDAVKQVSRQRTDSCGCISSHHTHNHKLFLLLPDQQDNRKSENLLKQQSWPNWELCECQRIIQKAGY